ncbi:MAG: hypothetical protein LBV77_05045 [Candidatus Adiutrix intracellularis]|jgi:hypothetical protein|nr:hypothetical protein [Candidatus Adiutrix intracellularis]
MKDFVELNQRLQNLTAGLDGDLWFKMVTEIQPPHTFPPTQEVLDMVFRDAKAISGYVPDMMAIMRRHIPTELDIANYQALMSTAGLIQLAVRLLLMILILPEYHDHQDLITTFNAYRQTLIFVMDYLEQAQKQ